MRVRSSPIPCVPLKEPDCDSPSGWTQGVTCIAYSPLGHSAVGGAGLMTDPEVAGVAEEVGKTPAQVPFQQHGLQGTVQGLGAPNILPRVCSIQGSICDPKKRVTCNQSTQKFLDAHMRKPIPTISAEM